MNCVEIIWTQMEYDSTWDLLLVEHSELVKLHNNDCLQCWSNPSLPEKFNEFLEKWGELLNKLYITIDQKYPLETNKTSWSETSDQHNFPNPGFNDDNCGSPAQINSDSNFIAIDIPDLDEGWEDPIVGDHDFEPALEIQNPGSPSLDFPDSCDNEIESNPLEGVNFAPCFDKMTLESNSDIPEELNLDSSDPTHTLNLKPGFEPSWDDYKAPSDENQIFNLDYDSGPLFDECTSPTSSERKINFSKVTSIYDTEIEELEELGFDWVFPTSQEPEPKPNRDIFVSSKSENRLDQS
jgi:hypothetical protein